MRRQADTPIALSAVGDSVDNRQGQMKGLPVLQTQGHRCWGGSWQKALDEQLPPPAPPPCNVAVHLVALRDPRCLRPRAGQNLASLRQPPRHTHAHTRAYMHTRTAGC